MAPQGERASAAAPILLWPAPPDHLHRHDQ